jgi:glycerol-3-phosphate dehydrogenase
MISTERAIEKVLQIAGERPELAASIVPELPDLLAEGAYVARHEQARSIADVFLRRTRLGLIAGRAVSRAGSQEPLRVARALSGELDWDEQLVHAELARVAAEAQAEGIAG